jgi:hypothetical protein
MNRSGSRLNVTAVGELVEEYLPFGHAGSPEYLDGRVDHRWRAAQVGPALGDREFRLVSDNARSEELVLNPLAIDRDYFSPSEAAWRSRGLWKCNTATKIDYVRDQHIPLIVPPHSSVSGFVYTNLDPAARLGPDRTPVDENRLENDRVIAVRDTLPHIAHIAALPFRPTAGCGPAENQAACR